MKQLKNTNTERNLMVAFSGESEARNKYTYFASIAIEQGYEQIAEYFQETADNEKEHAKIWFNLLNGSSDTQGNLQSGVNGENYEWTNMYPKMAQEAKDEGFLEIAKLFEGVALIEREHEQRYLKLLANIEDNKVFVGKDSTVWQCGNCGHIHTGKNAPQVCPVCTHPMAYFRMLVKDY